MSETFWRGGKPVIDHAALEDQMCSYTGAPGEESPDILDALVWAFTDLMVLDNPRGGMILDITSSDEDEAHDDTDNDTSPFW